jgi:hypothetical protein
MRGCYGPLTESRRESSGYLSDGWATATFRSDDEAVLFGARIAGFAAGLTESKLVPGTTCISTR